MGDVRTVTFSEIFKNRHYFLNRFKKLPEILRFSIIKQKNHLDAFKDAFEYSVNKYPNNILMRFEDFQLTYRETNEYANRVAHYLQQQGIQKGDVVALFMENRPEYLIYLYGIIKLGAVASLINNAQTGQVLSHSINLVAPKAAIVGEELTEVFSEVKEHIDLKDKHFYVPDQNTYADPNGEKPGYINIAKASLGCATQNPVPNATINLKDPCIYIYTSGTTGLPKATVQPQSKLIDLYRISGLFVNPLNEDDILYSSLPLYHATALLVGWMSVTANGASLAIRRKFSASQFWNDINRFGATSFAYVGELCRYLLNQPVTEAEKNHNIRLIYGNGLKSEIWKTFKERFKIDEIREIYGSSEGNIASFNFFNLDETVGMLGGTFALVQFDNETETPIRNEKGFLVPVKKGEPGLLLGKVTKLTPFEGYTDQSKNNGKLISGAFKRGDNWFNTGDLVKEVGYRHIQFVDRTGDTYRWKGENVSTSEVEMIANQYPEIEESIAYGVEIPNTNGRAGMLAITLKNKEQGLNEKAFYEYLSNQLPHYAVPLFLRINDSFEQTGTFKYQRTNLKKEAFDIQKVSVPIKVATPGTNQYAPLTKEILEKIQQNQYRF